MYEWIIRIHVSGDLIVNTNLSPDHSGVWAPFLIDLVQLVDNKDTGIPGMQSRSPVSQLDTSYSGPHPYIKCNTHYL